MVHRKNHDLRADLAEAQIAAQNWEDKFIESQQLLNDVRDMRDAAERSYSGQVIELRAELGQASRELMAVSERLDVCRKERGEALDNLRDALGLLDEATNFVDSYGNDIVTRSVVFIQRFRTLTPEGDTSESEKTFEELRDELIGVSEMHTTCLHEGFSHTKNLECPTDDLLDMTEADCERALVELEALGLVARVPQGEVLEHEEEDPDLNEVSEFEVVQP